MADVYKFEVRLCELEDIMWREIEVSSLSSVAKLGYTVMAAFEGEASHLFLIMFNGKRYEIMFDADDFVDGPAIDPIKTKLSSLKLAVGDVLTMEYDYGAGWEFKIKLLSITEMKPGTGGHYPYITDGRGRGIIEDSSPDELFEIVQETDRGGALPRMVMETEDGGYSWEFDWDYRQFDLELCNRLLKGVISQIRDAYEIIE